MIYLLIVLVFAVSLIMISATSTFGLDNQECDLCTPVPTGMIFSCGNFYLVLEDWYLESSVCEGMGMGMCQAKFIITCRNVVTEEITHRVKYYWRTNCCTERNNET